jgi:exodeoxyribonuclease VII small subunit
MKSHMTSPVAAASAPAAESEGTGRKARATRPASRSRENPDPSGDLADLRFESALSELEQIVQLLENSQPDLESAITAYQRGHTLLRHCEAQLASAEQKIRIFENGSLSPLDTGTGEPAPLEPLL